MDLDTQGPKRLFLQVHPEDVEEPQELDSGEVTWCEDQQNDSDTEYVRKDIHEQALAQAREALVFARAEVDVLRGVDCEADGDGPCGVCIKCKVKEARAEGAREARKVAIDAYHDAQTNGCDPNGAWECAIGAIRALEVTP